MNRRRKGRLAQLPRAYRRSRRLLLRRLPLSPHTALRHDPAAPELLLSPHWDDAVLGCWSLLASERELLVLNVFGGLPAPGRRGVWERVSGARDSRERAQMRIAEDREAMGLAGREPINLPLLDVGYRRKRRAAAASAIDRAVCEAVPGPRVSRVYAPAAIGGHADHLLVRAWALVALRDAGIPVELYAEPPYCVFHGWPAWVDGGEPDPARDVDAYWCSFLGDVPGLPDLRAATVERLDEAAASAKLSAIERYRVSLNLGARRLLAEPLFHRYEVRWTLVDDR
jgi:LmbE family N-acetylglucosaminyl deacetylase